MCENVDMQSVGEGPNLLMRGDGIQSVDWAIGFSRRELYKLRSAEVRVLQKMRNQR
jgi:hypothetical protein